MRALVRRSGTPKCRQATACIHHHASAPFSRPHHQTARRAAFLCGVFRRDSGSWLSRCWPQQACGFWVSAEAPEPDNIFRKILIGDAAADILDDSDSELFSFHDKNPASMQHYLVIPRRFVRDASVLTPDDAFLVQRMVDKARELVQLNAESDFEEDELVLGFHWPPWYSVPWLHLHAIYPRSKMKRRYKYTSFSFKSPEWVLHRLAANKARGGHV